VEAPLLIEAAIELLVILEISIHTLLCSEIDILMNRDAHASL